MKIIAFLSSFVMTLILTFFTIKLSYKRKILDYPKTNSIHQKPIPILGGIVIFLTFFSSCIIFKVYDNLLPFFLASLPLIVSSVYDDIRGLNAAQKLFVQFVSCIILVSFGIVIGGIRIPFGAVCSLEVFLIPVTIIWLVFIINLINIIDGLDGLASGLSAIIFISLLNLAHSPSIIVQMIILLAAISAFLIFNFYPAKIFLGNNGSTFLGFAIAYFALATSQKSTIIPIMALPCFILFIHLIDIAYAVLRRTVKGVNVFKGDKYHIHHLMLESINNHRLTVLLLYLISAMLAFIALRVL